MAKKPRKKYSRGPTATDIHVGSQIRTRRVLLGLSQEKLADGLDISFQQVQKYERGSDRVSASRLYYIAQLLNVPAGSTTSPSCSTCPWPGSSRIWMGPARSSLSRSGPAFPTT